MEFIRIRNAPSPAQLNVDLLVAGRAVICAGSGGLSDSEKACTELVGWLNDRIWCADRVHCSRGDAFAITVYIHGPWTRQSTNHCGEECQQLFAGLRLLLGVADWFVC